MAETISDAISAHRNLVVEAGTGTGKTYGYLVPILLNKYKAIISTDSKALQDQLFLTDIPKLSRLLGMTPNVIVWKGKSNYICQRKHKILTRYIQRTNFDKYHFSNDVLESIYTYPSNAETGEVQEFFRFTGIGEKTELKKELISKLVSDSRECYGQNCPFYEHCFHRLLKKRAMGADIIVVNHALLCFGASIDSYFPHVNVVVVDEAHKLPDRVRDVFSVELSKDSIEKSLKEIKEALTSSRSKKGRDKDDESFQTSVFMDVESGILNNIAHAIKEVEDITAAIPEQIINKYTNGTYEYKNKEYSAYDIPVVLASDRYKKDKKSESGFLDDIEPKSFMSAIKALHVALDKLGKLLVNAINHVHSPEAKGKIDHDATVIESILTDFGGNLFPEIENRAFDTENYYRCYIKSPTYFNIKKVPYKPSREFLLNFINNTKNFADTSFVLTSATLSLTGKASKDSTPSIESGNYDAFMNFMKKLGLDSTNTDVLQIDSPFDYYLHSLLVVPEELCAVESKLNGGEPSIYYTIKLLAKTINCTKGGIFFLCTSFNSVSNVQSAFQDLMARGVINRRIVLSQSENSDRNNLLTKFRENGRAILVGTKTFWEGVDVKGQALSMVIIEKVPFPQLSIEFMAEKMAYERSGIKDTFNFINIPYAIIDLKQGVGRLIRSENDVGVVIICSKALTMHGAKKYRGRILRSLPPMYFETSLDVIPEFWEAHGLC